MMIFEMWNVHKTAAMMDANKRDRHSSLLAGLLAAERILNVDCHQVWHFEMKQLKPKWASKQASKGVWQQQQQQSGANFYHRKSKSTAKRQKKKQRT